MYSHDERVGVKCPLCSSPTKLNKFTRWPRQECINCEDVYVGVHKKTLLPLGMVANKSHRKAKIKAHSALDLLWKECGWKRGKAYGFLAKNLVVDNKYCHIGMSDIDEARIIEAVSVAKLLELKRKDLVAKHYGWKFIL